MHHFSCCFCESNLFDIISLKAYHKNKKDHGPFSLYKCIGCDSLVTYPLPTDEQLRSLYNSFKGGIDARLRFLREKTPLLRWYVDCLDSAIKYKKELFRRKDLRWLDAGGGNGEFAKLLMERYPSSIGMIVDFNKRPDNFKVSDQFAWHSVDLNKKDWMKQLPSGEFDVIFSIAVLEHLKYPNEFLQQLSKSLSIGGMLFVVTPDHSSFAARALKKKWPYYLPGEHLHIPTRRGLSKWFQKIQQEGNNAYKARVDPSSIRYPIQYLMRFFRLNGLATLFPSKSTIRVRSGLLQLIIFRRK